ncbi:MAG: ThuA domain-containing protein [Candidatus Sumerlaeota bacterium]|nr:ThuA domain-containing protein [Candidatus Sumerlaeota bacterium]
MIAKEAKKANKAMIVWGGWEGHYPKACADLFAPWLAEQGYEVEVSNTLDSFKDAEKMNALSLVIPMWTMGTMDRDQTKGLTDAVSKGVGIAGFHGGMCDAFRGCTEYQWMTGGQWVAHPGNAVPEYTIEIINKLHPITKGLKNFSLFNTEQYYLLTDPSNMVLAETTFSCPEAPTGDGTVMPAVWTRHWGEGRVFYASWGHSPEDFKVPEALEIVRRGMLWASR